MCIILCHIGNELPDYLKDCLVQCRKVFNGRIYLITNSTQTEWLKDFDVVLGEIDFNNDKFKISEKVNFNEYPSKNFWLYSLARFFFIEDFVVNNKIENFVVFENDVLIFSDLKNLITRMSSIYNNIAMTFSCDLRATTGFSYFKSHSDLSCLNNDIIELIKNYDLSSPEFGSYPSEMLFIRKISKLKDYIKPLPSFPTDEHYDELGFIFDPASYGQFLGGVPLVHGGSESPHIDISMYVGQKIQNGEYRVFFNHEEGPIILDNQDSKYKIFNLHVWSKRLKKFIKDD
jgi:hypothetical protein